MKNTKYRGKRPWIDIAIILVCTWVMSSQAGDSIPVGESPGLGRAPLFFLDFYQRHLSPLHGSRCPMYPSCSEYARGALEHYSPVLAFPLIGDRLLRCGHDFETYTDTIIGQHRRWVDLPYSEGSEPFFSEMGAVCKREKGVTGSNTAEFLFQNGFYEQAYHEYVRCLSIEPESVTVVHAAIAAYHAYDYQRFTRELSNLVQLLPEKQHVLRGELYLLAAKRCYAEGLYLSAYTVLEKYRKYFTVPVHHEEYRLLASITALFCGIDSVRKLTKNEFAAESPLVNYVGRIDSLKVSLVQFRPRSALAAGILSAVIPGSGYLIGERKRTALFALLFNGLLAWSTVEFARQKNYGATAFSAMLGSGFYIGTVVGSKRSVDSINQRKRQSIIKQSLRDLDVDP